MQPLEDSEAEDAGVNCIEPGMVLVAISFCSSLSLVVGIVIGWLLTVV